MNKLDKNPCPPRPPMAEMGQQTSYLSIRYSMSQNEDIRWGLGGGRGAVKVGLRAGQKRFSLKMCFLSKHLKRWTGSVTQVPCSPARFSAAQRVTSTDWFWTVLCPQEATGSCGSWPCQRAESQLGGLGGGVQLKWILSSWVAGWSSHCPHFLLLYPSESCPASFSG